MINFASNLNKMIDAGLGGPLDPPRTEVAVGHRVVYTEVSGDVVNFETNVIAPVKNLRVTMEPIQAGSGNPSPDNIRPITGRDSVTVWREASYDPSADPALTIQLGQTVYGGTVDVTTGTMTVDREMLTLTNAYAYNYGTASSGLPYISFSNSQIPAFSNVKPNAIPICNKYKPSYNASTDFSIRVVQVSIYIYDSRFTDLQTAKNIVNGTQIIYELATPLTIQLTPAQLSTLKGQNNVWSDAGNISLKYPYYEETEGY